MFSISVSNLHWLGEGSEQAEDLCLHGDAVVHIGDECFEYSATVSSTALYLLKSLTEDHITRKGTQKMLPCCGFNMFADESLSTVDILGCDNGIDWSVIHKNDYVILITHSEKETRIPLDEYKQIVFAFADEIEAFYKNSASKVVPDDLFDRNGYIAFWNEWNRRRYG